MEGGVRSPALRGAVLAALLVVSLAGATLVPRPAAGATVACGSITTATTWTEAGNPHYATCDVIVEAGASLTVQAGVVVLADPGVAILVRGYLTTSGAASARVTFASNASAPAPGDWEGIVVEDSGFASIHGTDVRHAVVGVRARGSSPGTQGGVYASQSSFADSLDWGLDVGRGGNFGAPQAYLAQVDVRDNARGVNATGFLYVTSSRVTRNGGVGIQVSAGDRGGLYLNGSVVADNGGSGVVVALTGSPGYAASTIACNEIARNGAADPIGSFGVDLVAPPGAILATVSRNNFADNAAPARDAGASAWDDGARGNFWSDYAGTDGDGDGFGDTPYVIDGDSADRFPYMTPVAGCPPIPKDDAPGPATPLDARLTGAGLEDLELTWQPSRDDGAGEDDVVGYALYRGTTYSAGGAGYALLAEVPGGTTSYTDAGAGVGDPERHFYRLVAKDASGQTRASETQFAKYVRTFAAGTHLVSVPIVVSDPSVENVLRTVDFRVARTYVNPAGQGKNWYTFHKDKPWSDLRTLGPGTAFWIVVERGSDLVVAGLVPPAQTVPLRTGWNLVGYPSLTPRTVADALAGAKVQTVEGFDPGNAPFYLRRLGPADVLREGDGLWVHVSEPFSWTLRA